MKCKAISQKAREIHRKQKQNLNRVEYQEEHIDTAMMHRSYASDGQSWRFGIPIESVLLQTFNRSFIDIQLP